jgi:hypothetical protein
MPNTASRSGALHRRFASLAVLVVGIGLLVGIVLGQQRGELATAPAAVAGTPGGAVVTQDSLTPVATRRPVPSGLPTPTPSRRPAPPATPAPALPVTPLPATEPASVAVAAVGPADTVAEFYRYVAAGEFDAAYGLWSDRMKATYPRQGNLDERFDNTASITFRALYVAEQDANDATVQANFGETYDSGASRQFIGYWRLTRREGRWLLDEPHY